MRHAIGHLPLAVSATWTLLSAEGTTSFRWATTALLLSAVTSLATLTITWSGGGGPFERRLLSALATDGTEEEVSHTGLIHPRAQSWPSRFDGHLTLETQPTVAVWP